jgi:hypothetical protein
MTQMPEGGNPEVLGNTIFDYLHACNTQLNAMPLGEERDDYGRRARDELDGLWQEMDMMGERCMVTGLAVYPKQIVEEGDESIKENTVTTGNAEFEIVCETATLEGISLGFEYTALVKDIPPMLCYVFQLNYLTSIPHPTMKRVTELSAYFGERGTTILPLNMIDDSYTLKPTDELEEIKQAFADEVAPDPVFEQDQIRDALIRRSNGLRNLLSSTKFRRMQHDTQISIVDRIIKAAESETGVPNMTTLVEAQYAYLTQPHETAPAGVLYEGVGLEGMVLSGVCRALTMLGRERLTAKAIRRDKDLLTKHEGLVMSVEVNELTVLPQSGKFITPGDIVHVPISGQEMVAVFASGDLD